MLNKLITAIILFLLPASAFAAPSVTGYDQTTGVVSGTGFGTKNTHAPLAWKNMEDGSNGASIDSTGYWSLEQAAGDAFFTSTNNRNGSGLAMLVNIAGSAIDGDTHDVVFRSGFDTSSTHKYYLSFWTDYNRGTVDTISQIKLFRVTYGAVSYLYPALSFFETDGWARYQLTKANTDGSSNAGGTESWTDGTLDASAGWQFVELEVDYGTYGNTDAEVKIYVDGAYRGGSSGINYLDYPGYTPSTIEFGLYVGQSDGAASEYFDDIYFDNEFSRVMLCSGPSYSNRGSCEMQIPTNWGASTITTTVNTGAFATDDPAYVYVVADDGTYNSTGYAVTIGSTGGGDTTAPTVTGFDLPATYHTTSVPVNAASCSDDTDPSPDILINQTASPPPNSSDLAWAASWSTVEVAGTGSQTAYMWCKDASGNVSLSSLSDTVVVSSPTGTATFTGSGSFSIQ